MRIQGPYLDYEGPQTGVMFENVTGAAVAGAIVETNVTFKDCTGPKAIGNMFRFCCAETVCGGRAARGALWRRPNT